MSDPGVGYNELLARVAAIEARQRAQGVHDPGCPAGPERTVPGWGVGPCACWLVEPAAPTQEEALVDPELSEGES